MEEKLFWISLVSGVYALAFKRFLKVPKRLDNPVGVCLLNGLFWAFVGVAAGFLVVSYRELNTLSVPLGIACAGAGGLLGVLWILPPALTLASVLWPVQAVVFPVALGGLLGVPAGALTLGTVGVGLLGVAAGQLARGSEGALGKAAVSGLLCAEGALAGYWFSSSGGGNPSLVVPLVLAAGGYVVGHGWRPRARWSADENAVRLRESLEWADTGFSAILLASVIMYFVVQAFKIPSGSMRSTLLEGDHLFVNKFYLRVAGFPTRAGGWCGFERFNGETSWCFRFPTDNNGNAHYGKDFIKRAIALPGDTVEIRDKKVFVNGQLQSEPFAPILKTII
jgi:signal peptidase I